MAASDLDFLDIIECLGPGDLQRLYRELGIRLIDVQKWEIDAGQSATVDLKAFYILVNWRREHGKDATRQVLLEALHRCGQRQLKTYLEIQWSLKDKKRFTPSELNTAFTEIHETAPSSDAEERLVRNCSQAGLVFNGDTPADGNCLFHAVSDQLYLLGARRQSAAKLRSAVVDFLRQNPTVNGPDGPVQFTLFVDSDWTAYLDSMAKDGTWGDSVIVVALAHMLQRHILVVTSSPEGSDDAAFQWIVARENDFSRTPIRLGHIWEYHYRSLRQVQFQQYSEHRTGAQCIIPQPSTNDSRVEDEPDDILVECQKLLRSFYIDSFCKIPLFPGDYESYVNLRDIYTKVSIEINLPKPCRPLKIPLDSYDEMFTRKTPEGHLYTKLLLSAPAGLGKTTLMAKIAYDWATQVDGSPLGDIKLLFIVNMRSVDHTSNLENVILNQTLPRDAKLTVDQITSLIKRYQDKVIILLDAMDESDRQFYTHANGIENIVDLLKGRAISVCRLLVTTRPWRISEITKHCNAFVRLELNGFTKQDVRKYISKFFQQDAKLGESLILNLEQHPLVNEIASIPLMALLLCIYWQEIKNKDLPQKVGHIFHAIINILYKHYREKHKQEDCRDIQAIVRGLGRMALRGYWPPENRIVFEPTEAESTEDVDLACAIGLVSKEEHRLSVLDTQQKSTLTFFHKTCGEKCAGEYLASLADTNPEQMLTQLHDLKSVQDALSVQLILQFACGSNVRAADVIMQRLGDIFKSQLQTPIMKHAQQMLKLKETRDVQTFIDLCLRCNFEAGVDDRYNNFLNMLFPEGRIYFVGISALTALTLGYYMSHSQLGYIQSIHLIPSASNISEAFASRNNMLYTKFLIEQFKVNTTQINELKHIIDEYAMKHNIKVSSATESPPSFVSLIQLAEACEGQPSVQESNIRPVIANLKYIYNLKTFDINAFKIGTANIDLLIRMIIERKMEHLENLNVANIGMDEKQVDRLASDMLKMPRLRQLNISYNRSPSALSLLCESLTYMISIESLRLDGINPVGDSMAGFVRKLDQFGPRLKHLDLNGNRVTDSTAMELSQKLPSLKQLIMFSVNLDGMRNPRFQRELLSAMCSLALLQNLRITHSQYMDDLIMSVTTLMPSLPNLNTLHLSSCHETPSQVKSLIWENFMGELKKKTKLKALYIIRIGLVKDDFSRLMQLCRTMQYRNLGYSWTWIPQGVNMPRDEFLFLA